mgnify:CR=1 FL=1
MENEEIMSVYEWAESLESCYHVRLDADDIEDLARCVRRAGLQLTPNVQRVFDCVLTLALQCM